MFHQTREPTKIVKQKFALRKQHITRVSVKTRAHMGSCKNPEPFQMVFSHVIGYRFFPLIVLRSAGFTPWSKDSHERGKGKGKVRVKEGKGKNRKGKGKRKEKERKRTGIGNEKEKGKKKERKQMGTSHDPFLSILRVKFGLTCWRQQMGTWHRWHGLQSQLSSRPHNAKWSEMIRKDPKGSEMCIASAQKKNGNNSWKQQFPDVSYCFLVLAASKMLPLSWRWLHREFSPLRGHWQRIDGGRIAQTSHCQTCLQALQALVWHLKISQICWAHLKEATKAANLLWTFCIAFACLTQFWHNTWTPVVQLRNRMKHRNDCHNLSYIVTHSLTVPDECIALFGVQGRASRPVARFYKARVRLENIASQANVVLVGMQSILNCQDASEYYETLGNIRKLVKLGIQTFGFGPWKKMYLSILEYCSLQQVSIVVWLNPKFIAPMVKGTASSPQKPRSQTRRNTVAVVEDRI